MDPGEMSHLNYLLLFLQAKWRWARFAISII